MNNDLCIVTPRLTIVAASDEQMGELINHEQDRELKQAYTEMLTMSSANPELRQWSTAWFIYAHLEDCRIGDIGFKGLSADGMVEIGYGLQPEFWGRGYATEAVQTLVGWALHQPGVKRIEAETEPANFASQRVLQKCGFIPTGTLGAEGPRFVWQSSNVKQ